MTEIVVEDPWLGRLRGARSAATLWWGLGAVIAALILAGLLVSRSRTRPIVAPPATPLSQTTVSSTGPSILVHVSGAVRRAGLYELPEGARVADAIQAAGGQRRGADLSALNLAQILVDGLKVDVPSRGQPSAAATFASIDGGALVSVNSADLTALETIPGIGPVKAAAIVAHREETGGFDSIEQLLDVVGIGPATLEAVRPYLTL